MSDKNEKCMTIALLAGLGSTIALLVVTKVWPIISRRLKDVKETEPLTEEGLKQELKSGNMKAFPLEDIPSTSHNLNIKSVAEDLNDVTFHEILEPVYIVRRGNYEKSLKTANLQLKPIDGKSLRTSFKPINRGNNEDTEQSTIFSKNVSKAPFKKSASNVSFLRQFHEDDDSSDDDDDWDACDEDDWDWDSDEEQSSVQCVDISEFEDLFQVNLLVTNLGPCKPPPCISQNPKLAAVNRKFLKLYPTICVKTGPASVKFSEDPEIILEPENLAEDLQLARQSDYKQRQADRERMERLISPILTPTHRRNIYQKIYGETL